MKKITLILILAVLISLAVVTPVLAGSGGEKGACSVVWHPRQYGPWVRNYHAAGNGWFGAPWFGLSQACYAEPPKTPSWAGN